MFTFEVFCGQKYGGWLRSPQRFETFEQAAKAARIISTAERQEGVQPFVRRACHAA